MSNERFHFAMLHLKTQPGKKEGKGEGGGSASREGVWDLGDPESRINNNICQASWSYFSLSPLRLIRYATWAR